MDDGTWTISELAERAAAALASERPGARSGRVRDVPNERLIRWYVTIGLVDPPLGRRGRVARYGHRHLLQLVSVKRRQAAGRSLADIQSELTGATDATLRTIAGLPAPATEPAPAAEPAEPASDRDEPAARAGRDGTGTRDRFWARPGQPMRLAAAAAPAPPGGDGAADGTRAGTAPAGAAGAAGEATADEAPDGASDGASDGARDDGRLYGLRLAPGVTLLLDGEPPVRGPVRAAGPGRTRPPSPGRPEGDDAAALREAARPLLETLVRRGLLAASALTSSPSPPAGSGHVPDPPPPEGKRP